MKQSCQICATQRELLLKLDPILFGFLTKPKSDLESSLSQLSCKSCIRSQFSVFAPFRDCVFLALLVHEKYALKPAVCQ